MSYSTTPTAIAKRRERARARMGKAATELDRTYASKGDRALAMVRVDEAYARQSAPTMTERKCCTRCKTPFGICGNKACACHSH